PIESVSAYIPMENSMEGAASLHPLPGENSCVEPPDSIPNSEVKRARADGSVHLACESRSSPGSLPKTPQLRLRGFSFARFLGGRSSGVMSVIGFLWGRMGPPRPAGLCAPCPPESALRRIPPPLPTRKGPPATTGSAPDRAASGPRRGSAPGRGNFPATANSAPDGGGPPIEALPRRPERGGRGPLAVS